MKNIQKNTQRSSGILLAAMFIIPAASAAAWTNFAGAITDIKTLLTSLGALLITAATVVFFWGVVKFMWQDKKEEGKANMVWGIIGLFVLFSIWGIIAFLQTSTFGGGESTVISPVMRIDS